MTPVGALIATATLAVVLVSALLKRGDDKRCRFANVTHREDGQEWRYDNREREHMAHCRECNPKGAA